MPEVVPSYVLDASVALKWVLRSQDEPHMEKASQVAEDFRSGRISLTAPVALTYEMGHALGRAARAGRITAAEAERLHYLAHAWGVTLVDDQDLHGRAWDYVRRLGCSYYDATYLALASRGSAPLIHADGKLRELLGPENGLPTFMSTRAGAPTVWIEKYLPEARRSIE